MRGYTGDQRVENLGEYASEAVYKDFPNPTQFVAGVEPRSTLPAKWWNWFQGKSTKNISLTAQAFLDLYGELNNLFTRAGIATGVSGDVTPQLHSVLQALFYANPNQDSRRVSANKTIDTTNALVEKLYVDTSGIIITFPDITGLTTLQYKHCEILNVSSGTITLTFPGSSGLGDMVIPPGGSIGIFASKKVTGYFNWRHNWHYSSAGTPYKPMATKANGRVEVLTPLSANEAANKGYVDSYFPIGVIVAYDGDSWVDNTTIPGWYACVAANAAQGCPDLVDRFLMGRVIAGASGFAGANSFALTANQLPSHTHTINHDHASFASGSNSANHTHTFSDTGSVSISDSYCYRSNSLVYLDGTTFNAGGESNWLGRTSASRSGSVTVSGNTGSNSANHTHAINIPAYTGGSGATGLGKAIDNRPAHYTVIYIRKCVA